MFCSLESGRNEWVQKNTVFSEDKLKEDDMEGKIDGEESGTESECESDEDKVDEA